MENNQITMLFGLVDEFGNTYKTVSKIDVTGYSGEDVLNKIGTQFNIFLKQSGYVRTGDYMLMEDLTEDELYKLSDYLEEIREEVDNND